jgi:uncharacterized protein (DUF1330 family)
MPAYVIVEMTSPTRAVQAVHGRGAAAVKAFGGEYLVRGGRHEVLEGDWQPHRVAMLRFPSYEQAKAFYDAEHVRARARQARGRHEYFNMVLVEGVAAPV